MKARLGGLIRHRFVSADRTDLLADERLPSISTLRNPLIEKTPDGRSRPRRVFVLMAVLAVLAAVPLATTYETASREGIGYLLLAVHDWIYLPLRGWVWTAGFPWNLTIWVPTIILATLIALDWSAGVSPLRAAQEFVIRRGLNRPFGRRAFNFWHRWAGRGIFRARFLEKVIESEINSLLEQMHDVWADPYGVNPLAGRVGELLLWSQITTRYGTPVQTNRAQCQLLAALTTRLAALTTRWNYMRGAHLMSGDLRDPEFVELAQECRRLLNLTDISDLDALGKKVDQGALTVDFLKLAPAVKVAEFALTSLHNPIRQSALTQDHFRMLREQRIVVAMLAVEIEKGRPIETKLIAPPGDDVAGENALALFLTAILAVAVACPDLIDETMGLLEEIDRLRFAVASATEHAESTPAIPSQLENMLATYVVAGRRISLNKLRAALDIGSFAIKQGGQELAKIQQGEYDPTVLGRGWARARGDLWSMSGAEGGRQ